MIFFDLTYDEKPKTGPIYFLDPYAK